MLTVDAIDFPRLTEALQSVLAADQSRSSADPTFLEITGYPALENVTSNILAFFMDPGQPHGLGSMFLDALRTVIGLDPSPAGAVDVDVSREVLTHEHRRIDIVASTSNSVYGIENKLYATLTQPLEHYYEYLQRQAGDREVVACLLTLTPTPIPAPAAGFRNVTYERYLAAILNLAGHRILEANSRYVPLFTEFIRTIQNLRKGRAMTQPEFVHWLADNEQLGDQLWRQIRSTKRELSNAAKRLGTLIDLEPLKESGASAQQWIWDAFNNGPMVISIALVHDVSAHGLELFVDTMIRPSGYTFLIGERQKRIEELRSRLAVKGIAYEEVGRSDRVLDAVAFPWDAEITEVQSHLQQLLEQLTI